MMSEEKQIEKEIEEMAHSLRIRKLDNEKIGFDVLSRLAGMAHEDEETSIARHIVTQLGYRKQSENVIELPCKVGTTLYFLYNSPYADKPDLTPRIYKTDDWHFEIDKTGIVINTNDVHSLNKKYDYHLGEAVFLTKEEAKQALARMKGGEE